jgi:hypothetical protein
MTQPPDQDLPDPAAVEAMAWFESLPPLRRWLATWVSVEAAWPEAEPRIRRSASVWEVTFTAWTFPRRGSPVSERRTVRVSIAGIPPPPRRTDAPLHPLPPGAPRR